MKGFKIVVWRFIICFVVSIEYVYTYININNNIILSLQLLALTIAYITPMSLLSMLRRMGQVLLLLLSGAATTPPRLEVVPYPKSVTTGSGAGQVHPDDFKIIISDCSADCDVLKRAADRYLPIILQPPGSTGITYRLSIFENRINASAPSRYPGRLAALKISTQSTEDVELQLGVDESYRLDVPQEGAATLSANTVWGALRGIETFAQLVQYQAHPTAGSGLFIYWTPMTIEDAPRYPWRGVMVDTSRHFLTPDLLRRTVDTMAGMKLNTLHWHIVDAESFPYDSATYPGIASACFYDLNSGKNNSISVYFMLCCRFKVNVHISPFRIVQ